MLGKKRNDQEIDNFFMEQAWKDMSAQLDEVMPVKKEKKSSGWMLVAATLLVGFTAGLSVMWGLYHNNTLEIATARTTVPDIETAGTLSVSETSTATNTIAPLENKSIAAADPLPVIEQVSSIDNTTSVSNKYIVKKHTDKKSINSRPSTDYVFEKEDASVFTQKENESISNKMGNQNHSDVASTENTEQQAAVPLTASIPVIPLPIATPSLVSGKAAKAIASPIMILPPKRKWNVGVYAGVTGVNKLENGLEGSVRIERKIGDRWALQSGIGYGVTNINAEKNRDYCSTCTSSFVFSEEDAELNADRAFALASKNTTQHHLLLPATVVFKPTGNMRLMLSMNWAFRLNEIAGSRYDPGLSNAISPDPGGQLVNGIQSGDGYNSFSERFSMSSLGLGVGYYLNSKTGIEFSYNHRFGNSTDTLFGLVDGGKYGHYFRLGIARYL